MAWRWSPIRNIARSTQGLWMNDLFSHHGGAPLYRSLPDAYMLMEPGRRIGAQGPGRPTSGRCTPGFFCPVRASWTSSHQKGSGGGRIEGFRRPRSGRHLGHNVGMDEFGLAKVTGPRPTRWVGTVEKRRDTPLRLGAAWRRRDPRPRRRRLIRDIPEVLGDRWRRP